MVLVVLAGMSGAALSVGELGSAASVVPARRCEAGGLSRCLGAQASAPQPSIAKHDVLSWPLAQLVAAEASGAQISAASVGLLPKSLRDLAAAGLLRLDRAGRAQVFVEADGAAASVAAALEDTGAKVERIAEEQGVVQAWVPVAQLGSLAGVRRARLPDYGVVQGGSALTEGDALLISDVARAAFGADGTGVRVGVISDGVEGLTAAQASGDLPSVNTTTCDEGPGSPTSSGAGAEGTAMLEIVHDIAPGAELWFGHFGHGFGGTGLDFMAAVNCLAQNTDVVVDDIGWFNVGAYDGTSVISQNVADALSDGGNRMRGYYTAVGNTALAHYGEPYIDSGFTLDLAPDSWNLQSFAATSATSDAGLGLPCGCADAVALEPGGLLLVYVQWNDQFGASANDYDMFLLLEGEEVAVGGDAQAGDGDPTEFLGYANETLDVQMLDLVIGNFNDTAAARTFDMFIFCDGCIPVPDGEFGQPDHNFNTPCSSVPNNADAAGGVVAVGAIDAEDSGADDIEFFSSCGPTNDGRLKPELSAFDGVEVTGSGGFPSPFYGTSAAAPHVAGVAALLLDCNGALTRSQLRDALLNTAVDLGQGGQDQHFGHGRLNALAAGASVCKSAAADTDGDTVANGSDADDDGDGCPDAREVGTREARGGRRNPHNQWDYFNPTGDLVNRVDDILTVAAQYFIDEGQPAYTEETDRTYVGPYPWHLGPPNGQQRIDDILTSVGQYYHDC